MGNAVGNLFEPSEISSRALLTAAIASDDMSGLREALRKAEQLLSTSGSSGTSAVGAEEAMLAYLCNPLPASKDCPGAEGKRPIAFAEQLLARGVVGEALVRALRGEIRRFEQRHRLSAAKDIEGGAGEAAGVHANGDASRGTLSTAASRLIDRQLARVREDEVAGRMTPQQAGERTRQLLGMRSKR
jgi:hypothetical protein